MHQVPPQAVSLFVEAMLWVQQVGSSPDCSPDVSQLCLLVQVLAPRLLLPMPQTNGKRLRPYMK
eukprot:10724194-Prorocentrum_lima.AAC.1